MEKKATILSLAEIWSENVRTGQVRGLEVPGKLRDFTAILIIDAAITFD